MGIDITNPNPDLGPHTFLFTEPPGAGADQVFTVDVSFTYSVVLGSSSVGAFLEGLTTNFANRNRFNQAASEAVVDIDVSLPPLGSLSLSPATVTFDVPFTYYNRVAHNEHQILKTRLTLTDNNDGLTDSIDIWLDITGLNDAPTAIADARTILDKFTTSTFSASTFLNNDDDPDVVPTPDVFTMTSATLLNGFTRGPGTVLPPEFVNQKVGTVALNVAQQRLTFVQNDYFDFLAAGESTKFKVNYSMNDGNGGVSNSVITFTLKGGATKFFAGNNLANNMLGENDFDEFFGNGGNDTIFARGGNDILRGNAGNDKLTGGLGADTYFGGTGKDTFFINAANETGKTAALRDKFIDFLRGQDKINLSKIDSVAGGSDQAFEFIGTAAFGNQQANDNRGQLRYDRVGSTAVVQGDIGHNNTVDFTFQITGIDVFQDFFTL